jgi:SAM-dependent methyltransferase
MREIPFADHFDAVINMFTAFGYLESEAEDLKVLQAVAKALKPGGRFFMDMLNREWMIANQTETDWHEGPDGTILLEHREFDIAASRNHVTFTQIAPDGGRREITGHHVRLYSVASEARPSRGSVNGIQFPSV